MFCYITEAINGQKARRQVKGREYLSLLRTLSAEDTVWLRSNQEEREVRFVDRFKRNITIVGPSGEDLVVVHAGDVFIKKGNEFVLHFICLLVVIMWKVLTSSFIM